MGDIDMVVQWKVTTHISSWIQRAGRAARGHGRIGFAVLLVEKSAFGVDPAGGNSAAHAGNPGARGQPSIRGQAGRGGRGGRTRGRGQGRAAQLQLGATYGDTRGAKRGSCDGKHDKIDLPESERTEPALVHDAPGEGIYVYIQTLICRRAAANKIFGADSSQSDSGMINGMSTSELYPRVETECQHS